MGRGTVLSQRRKDAKTQRVRVGLEEVNLLIIFAFLAILARNKKTPEAWKKAFAGE